MREAEKEMDDRAANENGADQSIRSTVIRQVTSEMQAPWPPELLPQIKAIDTELVRRRQLERLLPRDAVDAVVRQGVLPTAGERRVLTVMFVDIRDSTHIEDTMSPEETIDFLNHYLGAAAREILAHHGSVNKFIGDGLLAIFGVPDEVDHGASNALNAARAIHAAFSAEPWPTGRTVQAVVAIHTGPAVIGVVGLQERSDYAVLGRTVNVASRLEGEGKELGLPTVVSGAAVHEMNPLPDAVRFVRTKLLRGISEVVEIWTES